MRLALLLALSMLTAACAAKGDVGHLSDKEISLHLDLADAYLSSQDPRRSLQELQKVESQAKNVERFQYLLGVTYMGLKEPQLAAPAFRRATELNPESGDAWNALGMTYLALQDRRQAREAFERALSILTYLSPQVPALNLARMEFEDGKYQAAEEDAMLALQKDPLYPPTYLLLADLDEAQGRLVDAERVLRRGLGAMPEDLQLLLRLGENLLRQSRIDEARALFTQIIGLAPDSAQALVASDYLDLL